MATPEDVDQRIHAINLKLDAQTVALTTLNHEAQAIRNRLDVAPSQEAVEQLIEILNEIHPHTITPRLDALESLTATLLQQTLDLRQATT